MIKSLCKRAGFGFILGIAIYAVILALSSDGTLTVNSYVSLIGSVKGALILQEFLFGIYGALCMGGTVLYDLDRLPLALTSLIHCLICIVPYILLALFFGWADGSGQIFITTGIQLAAYFIVWLILYFRYRKETKELNEIQKHMLENDHGHGQ